MGWWAVYEREMLLMWKKVGKLGYLFSALLFPLIYLFAFGWGLGGDIQMEGGYLPFLAKGMLAVTVLLNSFQQTALSVSVGRFYFHTLQTVVVSPISAFQAVLGITLAGVTRGLVAGLVVYGVAMAVFGAPPLRPEGIVGIVLSALCFGALGIAVGLWVDNPDALSLVINCVITPMTFFCGSFFPLTKLPENVQLIAGALPLTLSNRLLRSDFWTADAAWAAAMLALTALLSLWLGVRQLNSYSE